jgi:hypothetical protein
MSIVLAHNVDSLKAMQVSFADELRQVHDASLVIVLLIISDDLWQ